MDKKHKRALGEDLNANAKYDLGNEEDIDKMIKDLERENRDPAPQPEAEIKAPTPVHESKPEPPRAAPKAQPAISKPGKDVKKPIWAKTK